LSREQGGDASFARTRRLLRESRKQGEIKGVLLTEREGKRKRGILTAGARAPLLLLVKEMNRWGTWKG